MKLKTISPIIVAVEISPRCFKSTNKNARPKFIMFGINSRTKSPLYIITYIYVKEKRARRLFQLIAKF